MYNLDYRDEDEWAKQAVKKRAERELSQLQITHIGMWGQSEYTRRQEGLLDILETIDPRPKGEVNETVAYNWDRLRIKSMRKKR